MIIVSIYDRLSETFSNPVVTPSLAYIGRELVNLVSAHPDHPYATNPEDFLLCHLADWNPNCTDGTNPIDIAPINFSKTPLTAFIVKGVDDHAKK